MSEIILRSIIVRRWRRQRAALDNRIRRDSSDPLAMDPVLFVAHYRVTKELFVFLCSIIGESTNSGPSRCTRIPLQIKILATLNFLATGSYQKPVAHDWLAPLSQPSVSRCINEVVEALNRLLGTYIKFPTTQEERDKIKQGFYEKFRMPGVIGCIDGTLVAIIAPRKHPSEAAFFSRKGFHAINTAIICDSEMRIIGICAKFGGAAHDSHVWRSWSISRHVEEQHSNGMVGWLLGDSGYPQRPWLMTPVLHAAENSPEAYYTDKHVHTRVCVERTIGLLKARWRCLLRHRVLHYEPTKCAQIINACAVLHNLCLNARIEFDSVDDEPIIDEYNDSIGPSSIESFSDNSRQHLINTLWQNRTGNN